MRVLVLLSRISKAVVMKIIRKTYTILIVAVVALFFSTCEKDEDVPISTAKVDITEQTASYRNVQQKGFFVSNATITSAELHYASDSTFSNYQTLALSVGKDKSYTASIAPLQAGATYYVRYKVANSYSSMLLPSVDTLHTLAYTLPEVATDSVGGITVSSFVGYGTLVDWGCDSLSEFGFCYGNSANPTIEGKHITCTEKDNHFSAEITGLDDGATYHMRAYAINTIGIAYGADIKFSTLCKTKPVVVTSEVTDITVSSAVCGGKIMSDGYSEITECGICYSKSTEPTIDDKKVVCEQNDKGEFSAELIGLNEGTAYHVRAYAVNVKGVAYGEDYRFSTKSTTIPTVTTNVVTDITTFSAVCGGKITSNGYSEITECGICYSTSTNPTIDDKRVVCEQDDNGEFSAELAGLNEGTAYHVRAYATNAKGTAYGEERNFTTVAITLPTVVTLDPSDITMSSAVCSGKITNDGNSEILACGICYGTSDTPTISDNVVAATNNSTNFTCTLNGLSAGTTYYVRAYAVNVKGVAYGEERSFTTDIDLPTAVTLETSDITISSAVCGGKITSDGNSEILACGICYSTSTNPTINDNVVAATNNSTNFTCTLSGLSAVTTYYVRAYATNAKGTAYGETMVFETADHDWVDLGLSVKWATYNVGATAPEEYGSYFAWGETTPKTTYDWSTYKYANGSGTSLTKYCDDSSYGADSFTDRSSSLWSMDDAATANWGANWRMPTIEEWNELISKCTWTWTTMNGVNGYKVKATNGNSIFLPAAGYRKDGYLYHPGYYCEYWSNSQSAYGYPNTAQYLYSYNGEYRMANTTRNFGHSVRPVRK